MPKKRPALLNTWNKASKTLINMMIAEDIFNWTELFLDDNNNAWGHLPTGGTKICPRFIQNEGFVAYEILSELNEIFKEKGARFQHSAIKVSGNRYKGKISVFNSEIKETVEVESDTIEEGICFLGLYAICNFKIAELS